jgi:sugar diacid utilization regulator
VDASTPLVVVPYLEDSRELIEEVRASYLVEVKKAAARLHAYFVRLVIENGLAGFVEQLAEELARPCAVETTDFKLVAAHNMGPTPSNQQKTLTEELGEVLNRELRSLEDPHSLVDAVRIGRRLVAPIILEGAVVGYFSMMLRPSDDEELMAEYLRPAVLAALVEFGNRRREFATSTVTHKSLLKDLLQGHNLAGSDQERLEQYFGLDICDGSLVFAVRFSPEHPSAEFAWNEERQAMVEMEGAFVFVVPVQNTQELQWKDYAEKLRESLRKKVGDKLKIQIGASRTVPTLLDLPDGYREARQALVTGSMIHAEEDFITGYGDLGVKRILYLMFDHPELDRFYEEHLAPLESYDTEWETELVETLRVYLAQGYNLNSAAKELFVHRHTMRYRLEQIAELLKVDIDSPEVLLNLQIAFQIREMKGKQES